ncbi:MAG TPA: 2OG-Fe(II) oxygenase [Steroidobacteraceae bacterium]|nr:2OG-Fe(II) oxygenase [Steroidobacteraceae bacterium]
MTGEPGVMACAQPQADALMIVDNFLPREFAAAMRADIDSHFATPYKHRPDTHQVWNFWYVPQTYTYLRTQPERVIQRASVEHFMGALRAWSSETLGLARLSWPYLSFYINGCRQGLHNDAQNGRFAFVYSLTRDERRSTGGETIVLRRGDPFLRNLRKATAGTALYELIEPRFNRLVVFDDRMVHGVQLVEGSMDPVEGRFVLHGHIEESAPIVTGPLPPEQVLQGLRCALEPFDKEHADQARHYDGPLVLRFTISPDGRVGSLRVILDRVFAEREGDVGWSAISGKLVERLRAVVFPAGAGETIVTLPLRFGSPVRRQDIPTHR